MANKEYQYDRVRKDVEDAAVNSEELGEMIKQRLIVIYGPARMLQWFLGEIVDERIDKSYDQARSTILARIYEELAQAYRDCLEETDHGR